MSQRSRIVSQGNPLCVALFRMNAQRRSPAKPCQDTSASDSLSAAIDLTGYRHNPTTRPTCVQMRESCIELPLERGALAILTSVERDGMRSAAAPLDGGSTPPNGSATEITCVAEQERGTASSHCRTLKCRALVLLWVATERAP